MPELVTVSAVASWTGASTATSTLILAGVEARIANYCNRRTEEATTSVWEDDEHTEFLSGELSDGVLLNWRPIVAVASVTLITGNTTSTSYTLTDLTVDGIEIANLATTPAYVGRLQLRVGTQMWDSEYMAAKSARVPLPNFGGGRNRIKVVYTGGFTTIPDDLKLAALQACKNVYDAQQVTAGIQSESLGNYSYTNKDSGEVDSSQWSFGSVLDLLQPYRSYAKIV